MFINNVSRNIAVWIIRTPLSMPGCNYACYESDLPKLGKVSSEDYSARNWIAWLKNRSGYWKCAP